MKYLMTCLSMYTAVPDLQAGGLLGLCFHEYFRNVTENRTPVVTYYLFT